MTEPLLPKRPATPEDFAAIIAEAASTQTQVRITGSNSLPLTRLDATRPIQPISTLRMNKLLEHAVSDMTVIAHAGITLEALQKQLAWHNQWLPIDPPCIGRSPATRTLGGLIASNSLGPLRFSHGDFRMLLLGTRWITANGTLIKGGGRTVKNVAGYSTPRMLIGSAGELGAIAEVTLRTYARPADEKSVLFYAPSPAAAETLITQTLVADITPAYIQLVGGATLSTNTLDLPAPSAGGLAVIIGFLGEPAVNDAQLAVTRTLPAAADMESVTQHAAQSGRLRLWMTSEPATQSSDLSPQSSSPSPTSAHFRLHSLSSDTAAIIAAVETLAARIGAQPFAVAEAASGVTRCALLHTNPAEILPALHQLARTHNATLVPTANLPLSRTTGNLESRIKQQLDPALTFGP